MINPDDFVSLVHRVLDRCLNAFFAENRCLTLRDVTSPIRVLSTDVTTSYFSQVAAEELSGSNEVAYCSFRASGLDKKVKQKTKFFRVFAIGLFLSDMKHCQAM